MQVEVIIPPFLDCLACCHALGSSGSLSLNQTTMNAVQENKISFETNQCSEEVLKMFPLVVVNMHCSARTCSGLHVAALLGKSWVFLPEYFLEVHVICGISFVHFVFQATPQIKVSQHEVWGMSWL
jgi:hypothetical protein